MIRLAVRVERDRAELVLAELLDLAPAGVEEVDVSAAVVEYAVYGAAGELPALPDLTAVAGGALVEITTSEIADDWSERWREFHRPLVLAGQLVVRPPWEPPIPGSPLDVIIDPGQAFGTGAHATTRLCLELLLEAPASARRGGFVDLGAGSGVLAIVAAQLGHAPVRAYDVDPLAVAATTANAEVNGVKVASERFDLRRDPLPELGAGDTVAANLLRPLLLALAERLVRRGDGRPDVAQPPPGRLIASGLLEGEADQVADALQDATGLVERARRFSGGWAAVDLVVE